MKISPNNLRDMYRATKKFEQKESAKEKLRTFLQIMAMIVISIAVVWIVVKTAWLYDYVVRGNDNALPKITSWSL